MPSFDPCAAHRYRSGFLIVDLLPEISSMAARIIRENLSPWSPDPLYPQDDSWPEDLRQQFQGLSEQISQSLSDDDVQRYGCYIQVVAPQFGTDRPVGDLAVAKAGMLLYYATRRVGAEKLIAGDFKDSALTSSVPQLLETADKHGLVSTSLLEPLQDAFGYRNLAVYVTSEAPNALVRTLCILARNGKDRLRVNLDHYRFCARREYRELLLEARAYGPKFDEKYLLHLLYQPSLVTRLIRCPLSDAEERLQRIDPIERLEIQRTEREADGRMISYLLEELRPITPEDREVGYVGSRIFHCDLLLGAKSLDDLRFRHVDTSHLVYSIERYEQRLDAKITDKVGAQGHHKIYHLVNATFPEWLDLLGCSFPTNELISEWLTAEPHSLLNEARNGLASPSN
jgi:hypothetical protein